MKTDIHPEYVESSVRCSCGNTFTTRSTKAEVHLELCNECHPFFTGKQKLVDSGGRVERFQRRYAKTGSRKKATPDPGAAPRGVACRGSDPSDGRRSLMAAAAVALPLTSV
jgi:large subunit ribosomal protein L31